MVREEPPGFHADWTVSSANNRDFKLMNRSPQKLGSYRNQIRGVATMQVYVGRLINREDREFLTE
jgi:uncharacterized protein YicC (UPF0701 family)